MTTPDGNFNAAPSPDFQPTLPLGDMVDWFNEWALRTDRQQEELQDDSTAPQNPHEALERARRIGGIRAARTMLHDLRGLLEAASAREAGELDDVSEITDD